MIEELTTKIDVKQSDGLKTEGVTEWNGGYFSPFREYFLSTTVR
jgi:hypothetical protein